ncbi:hypothetical protein HDU97_007082 [Phlyctochytrium planicorne]|nr:hypothetical protein HDU97_007082 [Phlyctochytrium planicorne]
MERPKRANAGSRMRQLIEEQLASSTAFREEEDDADFEAPDEDDILDSDFQSTDEEEETVENVEGYDNEVSDDRKAKRARLIALQTGRAKGSGLSHRKIRQSTFLSAAGAITPSTVVVTTGQGPLPQRSDSKRKRRDPEEKDKVVTSAISPARRSHRASTVHNKWRLDQKLEQSAKKKPVCANIAVMIA